MNFLMKNVEMPLIPVVADLEANGYLIDCDHFTELKARLEPEQALVLADIQAIAGTEINPALWRSEPSCFQKNRKRKFLDRRKSLNPFD